MTKYHIKPNGDPGVCVASSKNGCKYGYSVDKHYQTVEDARAAYEISQQNNTINSLSKSNTAVLLVDELDFLDDENFLDKYYEEDFEYVFEKKIDDYGIKFSAPKHDSTYIESNDDGSVFYRFEQLDELFDEFDEEDVRKGYSLDVELNTVQQIVSEDLVKYYAYTGETNSITVYDDEEEGRPSSLMRVLVHKGELYVIDGNHRFAAAKLSKNQLFDGIVIGMDDDMENMWLVPPSYFNEHFSNK